MSCGNCDDGMIVVCWDDLCRGAGYCMHGDGMAVCPCQFDEDDVDDYPYDVDNEEGPSGGDTPSAPTDAA